jgi:hypothetical protein
MTHWKFYIPIIYFSDIFWRQHSEHCFRKGCRLPYCDCKTPYIVQNSTLTVIHVQRENLNTKLSEFFRLADRHLFQGLTMLWRAFITWTKLYPRYGMVRIGLSLMFFFRPLLSKLRWLLECVILWVNHPVIPWEWTAYYILDSGCIRCTLASLMKRLHSYISSKY